MNIKCNAIDNVPKYLQYASRKNINHTTQLLTWIELHKDKLLISGSPTTRRYRAEALSLLKRLFVDLSTRPDLREFRPLLDRFINVYFDNSGLLCCEIWSSDAKNDPRKNQSDGCFVLARLTIGMREQYKPSELSECPFSVFEDKEKQGDLPIVVNGTFYTGLFLALPLGEMRHYYTLRKGLTEPTKMLKHIAKIISQ